MGKKISLMWYPMGGCSVHKPPFVRGPHVVQRALCPQGRPTAVKTKRDTGKASGSLFPSEKLSSVRLFKGRLWATRGVWIKTEIHWKRQRGRLARCKPSPNALGSMKGPWAGSKDHMPAHGAPGRGQSCSSPCSSRMHLKHLRGTTLIEVTLIPLVLLGLCSHAHRWLWRAARQRMESKCQPAHLFHVLLKLHPQP